MYETGVDCVVDALVAVVQISAFVVEVVYIVLQNFNNVAVVAVVVSVTFGGQKNDTGVDGAVACVGAWEFIVARNVERRSGYIQGIIEKRIQDELLLLSLLLLLLKNRFVAWFGSFFDCCVCCCCGRSVE